jgi:CheY-like chemotaxis protein
MCKEVNLDRCSMCPTILHIDHSRDCRELVERTLQFGGLYQLASAEDGQNGLACANELLPNLILLEIRLPDMSGLDVLLQLRANVRTRDIPIMMLSAEAHADVIASCLAAGAVDYITKPFDLHHLWHTIALVADDPSTARVVMAASAN